MSHSHRIRYPNKEPRIGSYVPVRGTFSNRFVLIRVEFAENSVPARLKRDPVQNFSFFHFADLNPKLG